jgi:hypothetical protein
MLPIYKSTSQEVLEMFVPSYQMHNVLNVYSNKLRHSISTKDQNLSEKSSPERVNLTSEGKRNSTIEKVSKEIFDKIIRFGSQTVKSQEGSEDAEDNVKNENGSVEPSKSDFVYNVIDAINGKTTNTVSVEDSSFLIQGLEQMSKNTIAIEKTDTGIGDKGESDHPISEAHAVKECSPVSLDSG